MKRLFIYKGLELEANINGYATYELLCCAQHNNSKTAKRKKNVWWNLTECLYKSVFLPIVAHSAKWWKPIVRVKLWLTHIVAPTWPESMQPEMFPPCLISKSLSLWEKGRKLHFPPLMTEYAALFDRTGTKNKSYKGIVHAFVAFIFLLPLRLI